MDDQGSTESLLLSSLGSNLLDGSLESVSTDALVNDQYLDNSTGSLLNGNVQELLARLRIPDTSYIESESTESTVLSPIIINYEDEEAAIAGQFELASMPNEQLDTTDPILSILYNKVQVFLLRNKLSLEFLKILKRYVGYLMENGLKPLNDKHILTLQNELSESYQFTPTMEEILNVFLVRPDNTLLKLAFFEHNRMSGLLSKSFGTWVWRCQMRVSLGKLEGVWQEYLKRKYLLLWSKKFEMMTTEVVVQANEFYHFALVSSAFDKWLTRVESAEGKRGLADHYFVDHYLRRLVKRMDRAQKEKLTADTKHNTKCQRDVFKLWKLRLVECKFTSRQRNLKKLALAKMKSRLASYGALQERADLAKKLFQINPFFRHWRQQFVKRENHMRALTLMEQTFVRKRTMETFKRKLKQAEREHLVEYQLDIIKKRFFFKNIWETRFHEQVHLYALYKIGDERLALKYIKIWKERSFNSIKAYEFWRHGLLTGVLRQWKTKTKLYRLVSQKDKRKTSATFMAWRKCCRYKQALGEVQHGTLVKRYFGIWREAILLTQKSTQDALAFSDDSLKTLYLHKWMARRRRISELESMLLILQKLHAISVLKHAIAHMKVVQKYSKLCDSTAVTRGTLSRFFRSWRVSTSERQTRRLEVIGNEFTQELQFKSKRLHFDLWLNRLHSYQFEWADKADDLRARNLQRKVLNAIRRKIQHSKAVFNFATEVHDKTLSLNSFFLWRERLEHLEVLKLDLEREVNKKNLGLLLNYLNVWSMRMLKSKRNSETVQIFRKRWDRAVVRGLMLLWKNRSDNSPKKVRANRLQRQAPEGLDIVTPTRRNSLKRNTIPGSERVKQHRLEAMKSHYGKVRRAIPSPVKLSTTLSSTAKRKIENEWESASWTPKPLFPPRISLQRINKNLASKIDTINFEKLPEVRLDPFVNADIDTDPKIDTSLLEEEDGTDYDESPTRRM